GNVAPDQISPDAVPGDAFGPQRPDVDPLDEGVADDITAKARIERDDVRVGILERLGPRPIARGRYRRYLWRRRCLCRDRRRGEAACQNREERAPIPTRRSGVAAIHVAYV